MIEGKGHRVDPREIFIVEQVLLARQSSALSAEVGSKRPDHRVENGDCRHLNATAALLQQRAKCVADQSEQHDTGIGPDPGDDPLDLAARAHHAPDMLHRLGPVELDEASSGHRMYSLSGRIRHEMEMKSTHR